MPYSSVEKRREMSRNWRRKNLARCAANEARYRKDHPELYLLCTCKNRAKKNGIPFTIDVSDVVIPEFCPVLGIRLHQSNKGFHEESPSIDRIDPAKGYVKDNVAVISFRANRMKQNATLQELKALVAWLEKVQTPSGPVRQLTASAAG